MVINFNVSIAVTAVKINTTHILVKNRKCCKLNEYCISLKYFGLEWFPRSVNVCRCDRERNGQAIRVRGPRKGKIDFSIPFSSADNCGQKYINLLKKQNKAVEIKN